ncbi:DUF58 domain-containing protein [Aquabacterium sp.]|uniref:DUF58 domain-containing protein n=1 Tax=Aquabacterium sp. TaxID=1872578 RepID=UPI003782E840
MTNEAPAEGPIQTPDALLRRLEWTVLRRLDGLLQGDYRTLWRGTGLDLADLREYQHADDVRHIDWNVTARLQVPHVRQFTEDRELTAWFLLDLTGSVDFGSNERTKLAVSEGFVTVLARLLTRHGNRVGALLYGTQAASQAPVAVLPPGVGRPHVLNLLARMRQRAPQASGRETVLADLLRAAEGILKRRSLVFVVSDFISAPGWSDALARLARRHEVHAVRLYDPLEMVLPDVGLVTIEDAESGEQLFVDTHEPGLRERYEQLAAAHEAALREALGRAGVDTLELATDDDLLAALLRFVALRRQRLRMPMGQRLPAALRQSVQAVPA